MMSNDPLSSNIDCNSLDVFKCCNCEVQLTTENEVTHIPSYLSSTPGELIKIRDAVLIVFEGDIRAKKFSFGENEKVAMCGECTPSFIDMYNAYTKFMGLTNGSSWLKKTMKYSVIWKDLTDDESEETPGSEPKNGKTIVRFEKVKRERSDEHENTDNEDDVEAVILPDCSTSPVASPHRKKVCPEISSPLAGYREKFVTISLQKLTEDQLKEAVNFSEFSKMMNGAEHVKLEINVGISDLVKREKQEQDIDGDNDATPRIVGLQSSTTSTSTSSKFYWVHRCPVCTRMFSYEKVMLSHYEAVHKKPTQQFTCQLCKEKFSTEWFYKNHILTLHDGIELNFSCQICFKTFTTVADLNNHRYTHNDNEVNDSTQGILD